MGFLDINTNDAVEPTIVPAGEYKIRLIGFITDSEKSGYEIVRMNKSGQPYFMPIIELADEPTAKEMLDYIPMPHEDMGEKEKNNCIFKIKNFEDCFEIADVEPEACQGSEGYAIIGLRVNKTTQEEENFIKKYM